MRDQALLILIACAGCGGHVSWPRPQGTVPATHADVRTVSPRYHRTSSQVLVREVDRPTRAALDWAAYHGNFMNADPPPEGEEGGGKGDASHPFGGMVELATLTGTVKGTPLTDDERAHPLAFAPMVEFLSAHKAAGGLEDLAGAVRSESWGLPPAGGLARQGVAEGFLHAGGGGQPPELWVKIEFQPWFHALGDLPDEDGDGVPEIYGRVRAGLLTADALKVIRSEYTGKVLGPGEVKAWAHQLASYWYPSYNTDLVPPPKVWPAADTEAEIKKELGAATFTAPAVVMRGKPQGKPTYNVFLVEGGGGGGEEVARGPALALPPGAPRARPQAVIDVVTRELGDHGGSFASWSNRLLPFQEGVRTRLRTTPAKVKAIAGGKGFLFFRHELEYVVGGDLAKQAPGKTPLPFIVEFKDALAARGVDFLFVAVPNKVEIYPDRLDPKGAGTMAGEVVAPFGRKLLLDLGQAGAESVDLLPAFLAERPKDDGARETLYQVQDTHWGHRGLELAAHLVAERIKQYPWYAALAKQGRRFSTKEATFRRHGDLTSRLPPGAQGHYPPESLLAHQVVADGGALYEDDPESPVVLLGDSFTGVYELIDCQHAGVSAHIAREIGYPVDLITDWGGGPNARKTLLRRGVEALASKRLVVWMMTARDLYHYAEDWEPLKIAAAK